VGERQMINFYVGTSWAMPSSVVFQYEARAVLPGEYIMEATAISLSVSEVLYSGERGVIRIGN
jgi:hypothetical protein